MRDVFICDAVRTPIGRYAGSLAKVRADDLAAIPIKALMVRNPKADWDKLEEVFYGCANQSGEDNRNVARMALLLAGLPFLCPASRSIDCVRPASMRSAPLRAPLAPVKWNSPLRAASSR